MLSLRVWDGARWHFSLQESVTSLAETKSLKARTGFGPKVTGRSPRVCVLGWFHVFLFNVLHLLTMKVLRYMSIPSKRLIAGNMMVFFHKVTKSSRMSFTSSVWSLWQTPPASCWFMFTSSFQENVLHCRGLENKAGAGHWGGEAGAACRCQSLCYKHARDRLSVWRIGATWHGFFQVGSWQVVLCIPC